MLLPRKQMKVNLKRECRSPLFVPRRRRKNVHTIHPKETDRKTLNRIKMAQNWVQWLNFEHDIEFSVCIKSGRSLHQSLKKGLCVYS